MSLPGSNDIVNRFNEAAALVVCWDIDGVLVDSEKIHPQKHILTLAKNGVTDLDVERAHKTPQIYEMPRQSGEIILHRRPLHGTSYDDVWAWAVWNRPQLKTRVFNSAEVQRRRCIPKSGAES